MLHIGDKTSIVFGILILSARLIFIQIINKEINDIDTITGLSESAKHTKWKVLSYIPVVTNNVICTNFA